MRYTEAIDETHEYTAGPEDAGSRLDQFLTAHAQGCSRSFLQKLIEDGLVTIGGQPGKASRKIKPGETIVLNIPELVEMSAEPEDIPLGVLYEDEAIIVINKQPGLVVHPSPGHERGTLVNALLFHCRDLSGIGGELRPGIVHRLDRDTSGCLVCAKSDHAHRSLTEQFSSRTTSKLYLALTSGVPRPAQGKVEGGIGRSTNDRKKMALMNDGGRYSLTYYKTVESFHNRYALVECDIRTGRTHQIRLHLRSVGAPVLCDADYGREAQISAGELRGGKKDGETALARQALHAYKLSFDHPISGQRMELTAPLPADLEAALALLRTAKP